MTQNKIKLQTRIEIEIGCFINDADLLKIVEALKKGLSLHFDEEIIKIKTRNI